LVPPAIESINILAFFLRLWGLIGLKNDDWVVNYENKMIF
jgi:hypothetical protein